MLIELDAPPPAPAWPEGFRVGTFEPDDARAFHAALNEAFADEWNFVSMPFERVGRASTCNAPDFDPTLWFIVRDGDEIAAVLRGDAGAGRRRLGRRASACASRGEGAGSASRCCSTPSASSIAAASRSVGLGVDAQNPTGATRLYERAGMHVAYEAVAFEKELA